MVASTSLARSQIGATGSFLLGCRRIVVHWRAIILLLILGFVAFIVAPFDEFVPFMLILFALFLLIRALRKPVAVSAPV